MRRKGPSSISTAKRDLPAQRPIPPPIPKRQGLAASVVINFAGSAFPPVAALISAPLLAQSLGAEGRGAVAAAQTIALIVVTAAAVGLPEAITYYVARGVRPTKKQTTKLVLTATSSAGLFTWGVIATAPWTGGGNEAASDLIRLAALSILPSVLLGLIRGRAAGKGLWMRIAAERILSSFGRVAIILLLFVQGELNPTTATAVLVFGPLLGIAAYLKTRSVQVIEERVPAPTGTKLAKYSFHIWLGAIIGILLMRADQALLVPLAGTAALGLYAVAVAISELPLVVNAAVRDVLFARQAERFDWSLLTRTARSSTIATTIVAAALATIVPFAIPPFFGEEFRGAIGLTWLLLIAVVIGTPGSVAGAGLLSLGKPGLRSLSLFAALLISLGILFPLAMTFGAYGAVAATLIGNVVAANLNIYWLRKYSPTPWSDFYRITVADFRALFASFRRLMKRDFGRE